MNIRKTIEFEKDAFLNHKYKCNFEYIKKMEKLRDECFTVKEIFEIVFKDEFLFKYFRSPILFKIIGFTPKEIRDSNLFNIYHFYRDRFKDYEIKDAGFVKKDFIDYILQKKINPFSVVDLSFFYGFTIQDFKDVGFTESDFLRKSCMSELCRFFKSDELKEFGFNIDFLKENGFYWSE